jgi:hypothetical protein
VETGYDIVKYVAAEAGTYGEFIISYVLNDVSVPYIQLNVCNIKLFSVGKSIKRYEINSFFAKVERFKFKRLKSVVKHEDNCTDETDNDPLAYSYFIGQVER